MAKKIQKKRGAPKAGPTRTQPSILGKEKKPKVTKKKGEAPSKRFTHPKGKKQPHKKKLCGLSISLETYEKMFDVFCKNPSINAVAVECGVSVVTARKYVIDGDPARKLDPIIERFRRARQRIDVIQEKKYVKTVEKRLETIRKIVTLIDDKVETASVEDLNMKEATDVLDKMSRLESFYHGGPDNRIEINEQAGWTLEQLKEYAETGKKPVAR